MRISLDDFRKHFELLSDEALLATKRDDLVAAAQGCYDEEVERRRLNDPVVATETGEMPGEVLPDAVAPDAEEELVLIATYNIPDEANLARGLLQSAEIPYLFKNSYLTGGGIELRLLVPGSLRDEALEILEAEISEDELAAQAEAAGEFHEYAEPEDAAAEG